MTLSDLLNSLRARGVRLEAVGGRLRADAPRGALTPSDKRALARHKGALLDLLSPQNRPESLPDEALDALASFAADQLPEAPVALVPCVLAYHPDWGYMAFSEEGGRAWREHNAAAKERWEKKQRL